MKIKFFATLVFLILSVCAHTALCAATPREARAAAKAIWKTSCFDVDTSRSDCIAALQKCADDCSREDYIAYMSASNSAEAAKLEKSRGMLTFYDMAFEKVLGEVKTQNPQKGEVFLWLVYNMGYVVKTSETCFAIDIPVRRAEELVPHLDFLLITHNHRDHFNRGLVEAMIAAGKPVISSFVENQYMSKTPRDYKIKGVSIKAHIADHNAKYQKFVMPFEIDCGSDADNVSIFHVGDSCNYKQLTPSKRVDIFIPHVSVGLDIPMCVNATIKPNLTLVSHILEMGHAIDKWRWSYADGLKLCADCKTKGAVMPIWGEKIVYSKKVDCRAPRGD